MNHRRLIGCVVFTCLTGTAAQAQDQKPVPKADSSSSEAVAKATHLLLQLRDRTGVEGGSGVGVFVGGDYERFKSDTTALEDSFKSNTKSVNVLIDYTFSRTMAAGFGVRYGTLQGGKDSPPPTPSPCVPIEFMGRTFCPVQAVAVSQTPTDLHVRLWSLNAYAAWNPLPALTVVGSLEYGKQNYTSTRDIFIPNVNTALLGISATARGNYDGEIRTATLGATYDVELSGATLTPSINIQHSRNRIDAYEESEDQFGLGFAVQGQEIKYLNTTLGLQARYAISSNIGVFVPQIGVAWVHEFENNQRLTISRYVADPLNTTFAIPTNPPDRDYFRISPAVVMQFPRGSPDS